MADIIYVPIEPLTERYTEQWYRRFPAAFEAAGFDVKVIDGLPLIEDDIKVGAFLDINSTIHYKMSQLQTLARMFNAGDIADGSVIFFGDTEFWGLESVRLMADMNRIKIKMVGFLHAASYTIEDAFSIAADYQQYTEIGWIRALDCVYVGSEYHKQAVIERRIETLVQDPAEQAALARKIKVTKNPVFIDEYQTFPGTVKKKKVLLSNRFDPEKRPGQTIHLFTRLKAEFPDWEFVVTTGRKEMRGSESDMLALRDAVDAGVVTVKAGLTKEQYHKELAEAYMVVSHSIEENYGYCIAEAIHYRCIPLLRHGLSHPEFVTGTLLFDYAEDLHRATRLMQNFPRYPAHLIPPLDTRGLDNIVNDIANLAN